MNREVQIACTDDQQNLNVPSSISGHSHFNMSRQQSQPAGLASEPELLLEQITEQKSYIKTLEKQAADHLRMHESAIEQIPKERDTLARLRKEIDARKANKECSKA